MAEDTPEGWYPDPGHAGYERRWLGKHWSETRQVGTTAPPPSPPPATKPVPADRSRPTGPTTKAGRATRAGRRDRAAGADKAAHADRRDAQTGNEHRNAQPGPERLDVAGAHPCHRDAHHRVRSRRHRGAFRQPKLGPVSAPPVSVTTPALFGGSEDLPSTVIGKPVLIAGFGGDWARVTVVKKLTTRPRPPTRSRVQTPENAWSPSRSTSSTPGPPPWMTTP